jgi:hypothetical protein
MKLDVVVWGQEIELSLNQRSPSVWVASGSYMGETHQTTGQSPGSAAARWREWAHTKGG